MKKLLTLFLALTMVFSLCACDASGEVEGEDEGGESSLGDGLNVGYGREDITPDFSVGLGGYSDMETRKSQSVLDYVYTTCIAITEGEETVLIYTIDNCATNQSVINKIREIVSPATGVPADHIFVGATHTHSAPSLNGSGEDAAQYKELFFAAALDAAQAAMADRAPATASNCTTEVEGMNFVRHYLLEDGSYAGPSFGDFSAAPIKDYVGKADHRMVLVKFDRADESKQDILMMNWQAHPASATGDIGYNNISADFIGGLRTKVEKETNMQFAYFTGASGNLVRESKIPEDKHFLNPMEYGQKLAEHAIAALPSMTATESTGIKTVSCNFDAEIDHSWDHLINEANEIYDLWKTTDLATGNAAGEKYGFTSVYQSRAIRTRYDMEKTTTLELNAFSVAGIGFTTGTYEMFSSEGAYVRDNSPFSTTFQITSNHGYIPNEAAYEYRSYEADTGYYAKGTAEKLAEKYVELLNSLQ